MFKPIQFVILVTLLFSVAEARPESQKCTAFLAQLGLCKLGQEALVCGSSLAKTECCRANSACPPGQACESDGKADCACVTKISYGSNSTAKFEDCPQIRVNCLDQFDGDCTRLCPSGGACIDPVISGTSCQCPVPEPVTCSEQNTPNCDPESCPSGQTCSEGLLLGSPCECKASCASQTPYTCSLGQDCPSGKLCGLDTTFGTCVCGDPCSSQSTSTCPTGACGSNGACIDNGVGSCTCAIPCATIDRTTCSAGACPTGFKCFGDGTNPCTCKKPCNTYDGSTTCTAKGCPAGQTCFGPTCNGLSPCQCNPTPCVMQSTTTCHLSTCPTTGQKCSIDGASCTCSIPSCDTQNAGSCSYSSCTTGKICSENGGSGCVCEIPPCSSQIAGSCSLSTCTNGQICTEDGLSGCYCPQPPCDLTTDTTTTCSTRTCSVGQCFGDVPGSCTCKTSCTSETVLTNCVNAGCSTDNGQCVSYGGSCVCARQCNSIKNEDAALCNTALCGSDMGECTVDTKPNHPTKCKCPNQPLN